MADEPIRKEMDALKADIAQLREDIIGLSNAVKGVASEKIKDTKTQAEHRLRETWEDIEQRLEDLYGQGKSTLNKAEQKVGEHPMGSVLIAFGVGFIIAKLIDMGSRR